MELADPSTWNWESTGSLARPSGEVCKAGEAKIAPDCILIAWHFPQE